MLFGTDLFPYSTASFLLCFLGELSQNPSPPIGSDTIGSETSSETISPILNGAEARGRSSRLLPQKEPFLRRKNNSQSDTGFVFLEGAAESGGKFV